MGLLLIKSPLLLKGIVSTTSYVMPGITLKTTVTDSTTDSTTNTATLGTTSPLKISTTSLNQKAILGSTLTSISTSPSPSTTDATMPVSTPTSIEPIRSPEPIWQNTSSLARLATVVGSVSTTLDRTESSETTVTPVSIGTSPTLKEIDTDLERESIWVEVREEETPSESGIEDLLELLRNDERSSSSRESTSALNNVPIVTQQVDSKPIVEFFTSQIEIADALGYAGNAEFIPEIFSQLRLPKVVEVKNGKAKETDEWLAMLARLIEEYLTIKLGAILLSQPDESGVTHETKLRRLLANAPDARLQRELSSLPEEIERLLSSLHSTFDLVSDLDNDIATKMMESLRRIGYDLYSPNVSSDLGFGTADLLTGTKKFFSIFQDVLSTHFDMHPLIENPTGKNSQRLQADALETESIKTSAFAWFPGNFWSSDLTDIKLSVYDRRNHNFKNAEGYPRMGRENDFEAVLILVKHAKSLGLYSKTAGTYFRDNSGSLPTFMGGTLDVGRLVDFSPATDIKYSFSTDVLRSHLKWFAHLHDRIPSFKGLRGSAPKPSSLIDATFLLNELRREFLLSGNLESVRTDLASFGLASSSPTTIDADILSRLDDLPNSCAVINRILGKFKLTTIGSRDVYSLKDPAGPASDISLSSLARLEGEATLNSLATTSGPYTKAILPFESYDLETRTLDPAGSDPTLWVSLRRAGVSSFLPTPEDELVEFGSTTRGVPAIFRDEGFVTKIARVERILSGLFADDTFWVSTPIHIPPPEPRTATFVLGEEESEA